VDPVAIVFLVALGLSAPYFDSGPWGVLGATSPLRVFRVSVPRLSNLDWVGGTCDGLYRQPSKSKRYLLALLTTKLASIRYIVYWGVYFDVHRFERHKPSTQVRISLPSDASVTNDPHGEARGSCDGNPGTIRRPGSQNIIGGFLSTALGPSGSSGQLSHHPRFRDRPKQHPEHVFSCSHHTGPLPLGSGRPSIVHLHHRNHRLGRVLDHWLDTVLVLRWR